MASRLEEQKKKKPTGNPGARPAPRRQLKKTTTGKKADKSEKSDAPSGFFSSFSCCTSKEKSKRKTDSKRPMPKKSVPKTSATKPRNMIRPAVHEQKSKPPRSAEVVTAKPLPYPKAPKEPASSWPPKPMNHMPTDDDANFQSMKVSKRSKEIAVKTAESLDESKSTKSSKEPKSKEPKSKEPKSKEKKSKEKSKEKAQKRDKKNKKELKEFEKKQKLQNQKKLRTKDPVVPESNTGQQSLLIRKFVRGSEAVFRWEYEETQPLEKQKMIQLKEEVNKKKEMAKVASDYCCCECCHCLGNQRKVRAC